MEIPYNPNINKNVKVIGIDLFEFIFLVGTVILLFVIGNIGGIVFPFVRTILMYFAGFVLLAGIPFLKFANKNEYKGFLFSFISSIIQKKEMTIITGKFPGDKRTLIKKP